MESRCKLCSLRRDTDSEYCRYHRRAKKNLEAAYEVWEKATDIGWSAFLDEVVERSETGSWARDVAANLLGLESS